MAVSQQLESLAQDVRYALRGFRRIPAFTLAAVFALALGTGSGTAVFSVVDRILFRSLPYPDSGRLVSFGMLAPIAPQEFLLAYDYLDWRDAQAPFTSTGFWTGPGDCDLTDANPVRLRCAFADAGFLPTLSIRPALGRAFTPREDRPGAPRVALISWGLWHSRLHADAGVIGRALPLDGIPTTILGVLPRDFEMPGLVPADVLLPQALDEAAQRTRKSAMLVWAIGRLKAGVTPRQAAAALQPLLERSLAAATPQFRKDVRLRVRTLHDRQTADARLASWLLLAAVAAVLLIACANIANLLVARAAARRREIAVRTALGASRARLLRQALTESVVLAFAGAAAGCALAWALLRLFVAIASQGIPRIQESALDLRVLLVTLAVALLCGLLFGLVPALESPRPENLARARRHAVRHALVAAQLCASLVLLTGAGLLLRSLWHLQSQPLGMRPEGVLTASVSLGRNAYPDAARRAAIFNEFEARLARIPGVREAALADFVPPLAHPYANVLYGAIEVEGRPRTGDGTGGRIAARSISPRYFAALGIPILRGRAFMEEDRHPERPAAILSDTLARRMFPRQDPLGQRLRTRGTGPWLTVVGVAGNVRNSGLAEPDAPELYFVRGRQSAPRAAVAIVRSPLDPAALAAAVRREMAALDPTVPVEIETAAENIGRLAARPRFHAVLLGVFAAMGLLLAAIGLYGVVTFLVAQRTAEIGLRMALGATPAAVARLVLRHAAVPVAAGAALGIAGSLAAAHLLRSLLFRLSASDPWTLAAAAAILSCVALAAAWLPARRAARIDPVAALRRE